MMAVLTDEDKTVKMTLEKKASTTKAVKDFVFLCLGLFP